MAEGATCGTNCAGAGACPGVVAATPATLIQTDAALDYTLVQLPTNLSGTYGYMRLRDTGPVVNERIYVPQHAAAWGKRIAVSSTQANDESGFCEVFGLNEPPCPGGRGTSATTRTRRAARRARPCWPTPTTASCPCTTAPTARTAEPTSST